MLSITECIVALVVVVLLIVILYLLFPLVVVVGRSMYPTFIPDQILVASRLVNRDKLVVKSVYIYNHDGKRVIKRLKYFDGENCYFLGDNSAESYDSRDYGFVNKKNIVAKIMWYKRNN